ncbi:MAG TPA: hypothetical protein PKD79_04390 [Candidatus Doudnabacteria bacterium]|nr:hypothetical protein [Candidatus Doudnabacteria bacterium]
MPEGSKFPRVFRGDILELVKAHNRDCWPSILSGELARNKARYDYGESTTSSTKLHPNGSQTAPEESRSQDHTQEE